LAIKTMKELLDYRIEHWSKNNGRNKATESLFCDELEQSLHDILIDFKYDVVSIAREYMMEYGRIDFLVKLKNDRYLIIEVKHSNQNMNSDLYFGFAVGQLLTYRTILQILYSIPKSNIDLMIISDIESIMTINVIENISEDIKYLIVGSNGVKYYGKTAESN
jgi:hypothetical protein